MSKPDKIPIKTKKGTCYYGIAASSKVRVGSYGAKKICCWLGRQIKIEKAKTEKAKKQRRQAKTEKAGKDREGKKTNWYIQKYSYLTTAGGQLLYREPAGNTADRHSGLYGTCQCSALLKWRLCSMERILCQSRIFSQNHDLCLNCTMVERWNS